MGRLVWLGFLWLLALCAVFYAADWAVWQVRVLRGRGYRTVSVSRYVVASLKNGKEEYYFDGKGDVQCSISLMPEGFPQDGVQPCWYVEKHPVVFER